MIVRSSGSQPVRVEQDVVLARQTVRKLTQDCAMRLIDQTKPGHRRQRAGAQHRGVRRRWRHGLITDCP